MALSSLIMSGPLIYGRNIAKSYGQTTVLSGVSFEIFPGITGILGANGTGKTTLLGMILGLHPRDSGELNVFGADPWKAGSAVRERIGYSPEHHTMSPDMPAVDFVTLVGQLHGLPKHVATSRGSESLWIVGLGEERFRPMGTLSTGQKQRVKLAQALSHDPKLIILDEPTDGLDPNQRDSVLDVIKKISDEFGISVLISSHLIEEVERICDAVVIIGEGRTLAAGSIEHLKQGVEAIIEVELVSPSQVPAVAKDLEAQPSISTVRQDAGRLFIDFSNDKAFDEVRDVLANHEAGIISLRQKAMSLEDIFLENMR